MASRLFGNGSQMPQNNFLSMIQQFNQFKQQMGNKDPKAMVQELLSSGKMSKQQYEQLSGMAQQLSSILK